MERERSAKVLGASRVKAAAGGTMEREMAAPVIIIDPEIISGMPCFRGTRVPFKNLIDYLEGGHSLGEFLEQFPTVTREMSIQARRSEGIITS